MTDSNVQIAENTTGGKPPLTVEVQCVTVSSTAETDSHPEEEPPSGHLLTQWAQSAYQAVREDSAEMTIRLVDAQEMQQLNRDYRGQDKTTNVLSFPMQLDAQLIANLGSEPLGDIVICHNVVVREARQQNKRLVDHYAHMVTHGTLHLCGYDHEKEREAQHMESLEVEILAGQNIANPYQQ